MVWGRWRSISRQGMGRTGRWTAKAGRKLSHSPLSRTEHCFTRAVLRATTKGRETTLGPTLSLTRRGCWGRASASPALGGLLTAA